MKTEFGEIRKITFNALEIPFAEQHLEFYKQNGWTIVSTSGIGYDEKGDKNVIEKTFVLEKITDIRNDRIL
jgi:hypothetical protein